MLKNLLLLVVLLNTINAFSQDSDSTAGDTIPPNWIIGGRVGLNFTNVTLSNWASGGQESYSGTGNFLITANYTKNKASWKNSFEIGYGLIQQGDGALIKSDDKIELSSRFNYKFKPKWSYSNVLTFRSQFAPGYDPPEIQEDSTKISDWLAPGYVQMATGIGYEPTDYLEFMLSPATYKLTIVMDQMLADQGAYGVDAEVLGPDPNNPADTIQITPGKNIRNEIGASFRMNFKKEIVKNVEFESILDLFSSYLQDPTIIDVNWVNNVNMKINDFLTASILTQLIYDQDIKIASENDPNDVAPRTQFKSVLGIGLAYKF